MHHSLINGFIRPDGSILKGDHHNPIARNELNNKENISFLKNFQIDPYISPASNLIKAGYLLVSTYTICLPSNPTQEQFCKLIDMLALCDINHLPEIDSENLNAIKLLANFIQVGNNQTLKFLKSFLLSDYSKKQTEQDKGNEH